MMNMRNPRNSLLPDYGQPKNVNSEDIPSQTFEYLSKRKTVSGAGYQHKKPITWIAGPAGSGKTTLVASYLDVHDSPSLWYQLDTGDSDIATFFYYMGLAAKKAAPRFNKPLPLLTSEYLMGISTFSQRYFEKLYSRLTPPYTIVFDDYQEVDAASPLHEVIRDGLSLAPEGITIFVLSRGDPLRSCRVCAPEARWESSAGTISGLRSMNHGALSD